MIYGEGPCGFCGINPAVGYASVYKDGVETWYCHDEGEVTCYERRNWRED